VAVRWVSRLIGVAGLALFLYALSRPWIALLTSTVRVEYAPLSVLKRMAEGAGTVPEDLMGLVSEAPEGEKALAALAMHLALLVIALIFAVLSPIAASGGGYAATAVFTVLSLAALFVAAEYSAASYSWRAGALLALASAFVYLASYAAARALE
jgi:drug/metabolite transporter superfamily protein YnfA